MPFRRAQRALRHLWLSSHLWRRRLVFWAGAIAVGYAAVGFAQAANAAQALFGRLLAVSPWAALPAAPAAVALSAWAARRFFPGSQGSGIPQTIAARDRGRPELRQRLLAPRIALGKIVLCLIGLLGGASIGREGPTVQVGASIMLWVARASGMGREPGLILAGSAAGVAAAFNTPLAGIVFAIEEMSRSFEQRISALVLIAVVLAGVAALSVTGSATYFGHSGAALSGPGDWAVVVATGVLGGVGGGVFSRLLLAVSGWLAARPQGWVARHPVWFAAACGLVLALIGLASHGATFGTGYAEASGALSQSAPLPWTFAPLKLAATLISSLSGMPGGLFAPSLSVGAGLGSALAPWFPSTASGAVVLLGMAGYFAGVVQAPMTAFVIVTEMADDHAMLVPLMAATVIAYGISRLVAPAPLYHGLAARYHEKN